VSGSKSICVPMIAVLIAASVLSGCAHIKSVEPWEKSTLAKETMKPVGPVPALSRIDGHVYYSKEAVRGGTGVGGGGCGCN
jgi:Domain of unknown function (DUF4266)